MSRFHSIILSGLCPCPAHHNGYWGQISRDLYPEPSAPKLKHHPLSLRNLTPETPAATAAPPPTPVQVPAGSLGVLILRALPR